MLTAAERSAPASKPPGLSATDDLHMHVAIPSPIIHHHSSTEHAFSQQRSKKKRSNSCTSPHQVGVRAHMSATPKIPAGRCFTLHDKQQRKTPLSRAPNSTSAQTPCDESMESTPSSYRGCPRTSQAQPQVQPRTCIGSQPDLPRARGGLRARNPRYLASTVPFCEADPDEYHTTAHA